MHAEKLPSLVAGEQRHWGPNQDLVVWMDKLQMTAVSQGRSVLQWSKDWESWGLWQVRWRHLSECCWRFALSRFLSHWACSHSHFSVKGRQPNPLPSWVVMHRSLSPGNLSRFRTCSVSLPRDLECGVSSCSGLSKTQPARGWAWWDRRQTIPQRSCRIGLDVLSKTGGGMLGTGSWRYRLGGRTW